jgi:hypothetical protein
MSFHFLPIQRSLNFIISSPASRAFIKSIPPNNGTPTTERANTTVRKKTIIDYLSNLAM